MWAGYSSKDKVALMNGAEGGARTPLAAGAGQPEGACTLPGTVRDDGDWRLVSMGMLMGRASRCTL